MAAKRILFFAEAVTLAHVARPIVLARALAGSEMEPVVACDVRYRRFLEREPWETLPLNSISSAQFLHSLAKGRPVYDARTLRGYVEEDLRLIDRVQPDLVVGDFRLSLSVSARLAKVPYAAVVNAYWSPYYTRRRYPLPELPLTRFLPLPVAEALFQLALPIAFAQHCRPLNDVRREYGLQPLGSDLRRVYTDADHVLYADSASLFPTRDAPPNHHYLGPIVWSADSEQPGWWNDLPADRPVVYVTLGSSGRVSDARRVLRSVAELPVTVIASTAGAALASAYPPNLFVADYLPGAEAAARSQLVVCNGGSPTSQQALVCGTPVLGIASNMDQFLNMQALSIAGVGETLRASRVSAKTIEAAVQRLLGAPVRRAADLLSADLQTRPSAAVSFRSFLENIAWHSKSS